MPQRIEIAYRSLLISASVNSRLADILGRNGVIKGYRVAPGTGRSITLSPGIDLESVLFIGGTKIRDTDTVANIPIVANVSGSTRTDTLYAHYEHGVSASCSYTVIAGTTNIPSTGLTVKIAEIDVPHNASTIIAGNIRHEAPLVSISELKLLIDSTSALLEILQSSFSSHANATLAHGATAEATANRIMMRDANGRVRVAAPSANEDVARRDTVDSAVNTHAQATTHPATNTARTWTARQTMNAELDLNQTNGRLVVPVGTNRHATI